MPEQKIVIKTRKPIFSELTPGSMQKERKVSKIEG